MKNILKWFVCGLAALCCACSEDDLTGDWSYSGPVPAIKDGPTEADKGCYALYQKYDVHVYWQLEGDAALFTDLGQVATYGINSAALPMQAADEATAEKFVDLLTKFFDILPEDLVNQGYYRRHVLVKIIPARYAYTDTEGNAYFCNTYGATSMVMGAGSGVVYYGYLYNEEDTGDKFDTDLDGWKWGMAYEFFKGLIDCLDKPVNMPDEFREISADYYQYELYGTSDYSISNSTVFDKAKGGEQGFIHPYAAYASNSDFCDEDWGAMVACILTWDKAELEEIYAAYPRIKAKYDIIKDFFTEQYGLDIEQLADQWRSVTLD